MVATTRGSFGRIVPLVPFLLLGLLPPSARAQCTLIWGPQHRCLLHGEMAKEGLFVDSLHRSFSVGYADVQTSSVKDAVLLVRDASGALLSSTFWSAQPFNDFAHGIWGEPSGASVITVGAGDTGNASNPRNLVLTRWLPGSGIPWSSPVQAAIAVHGPGALGLVGNQTIGCRVIEASPTDVFVAGCTDVEIFIARFDKATLQPVLSWGIGGVQSVLSGTPQGCPQSGSPGAFIDFNFYPQAFVELAGPRVYLGGTLINDLTGAILDYDFVVAAWDTATGASVLPFGVRYSFSPGDDYMNALAASSKGVYACGNLNPSSAPQMQLVAWRPDGSVRAPGIITAATPSRGNDVEIAVNALRTDIYVGGYGQAQSSLNGATWHYRHATAPTAPVNLTPQWAGPSLGGPNPKAYGPAQSSFDEVFDIAVAFGRVYATGQALLSPGVYGQPLECIAANGAIAYSNSATPTAPADDRGVATLYHFGSNTVYTSGTAFDPSGIWSCVAHWAARGTRYNP
jgi:hypothetical protein